jgi:hypothetical protein
VKAAVLALLVVAGCQIDSRSDSFRCDGTVCSGGRTCVNGWCVEGDGGTEIDAAESTIDARECPSECTECLGTTCIFRCEAASSCATQIVCPDGWGCLVVCSGMTSCAGGIDCTGSTTCEVDCTQTDACGGAVECGTGPCDVACNGADSCGAGVACQQSCACDVLCDGAGSCATSAQCPFTGTCDTGAGCRSAPGACHSC